MRAISNRTEADLKEKGRKYYTLLRGRIPEEPYRPLIAHSELEVLAVAMRIRSACYYHAYFEGAPDIRDEIAEQFRQLATDLDLEMEITNEPSLWYQESGFVIPAQFMRVINAYHEKHELFWLYSDSSVEELTKQASKNRSDVGIALGYPKCCVQWHQNTRMLELQRWYRDAQKQIANGKSFEELRSLNLMDFSPKAAMDHAERTKIAFPFVSHVACTRCLRGGRSSTSKLNGSLAELARIVDRRSLYDPVIKFSSRIQDDLRKRLRTEVT